MKAYFEFRCDFGHRWLRFADATSNTVRANPTCPFQHDTSRGQFQEAVQCIVHPMIDAVEVAIRPAGRVDDECRHRIVNDYQFYLVVRDLHRNVERMSQRPFTWEQIVAQLPQFRNVGPERAWRLLNELDELEWDASMEYRASDAT